MPEPQFVRDALGKLEAEAKTFGSLLVPALDKFWTRQGIEGGVSFNRVEDGSVVPQEFGRGCSLRKEAPTPVGIGPLRTTEEHFGS